MKYQKVLFDLDGTLIDSWPKLLEAANTFFRPAGIEVTGQHMQDQYHLGKNLCTFLKEKSPFMAGLSNNEVSERFWKKYIELPEIPPVLPGVAQFLSRLRDSGLVCGIVTNKRIHVALAEINSISCLKPHFSCVFGAGAGIPSKPSPDLIVAALDKLCGDPASTLFVGDSSQDYHAAKAAGVDCVLVSSGDTDKHAKLVEMAGADCVFESYSKLSKRIFQKSPQKSARCERAG